MTSLAKLSTHELVSMIEHPIEVLDHDKLLSQETLVSD